MKNIYLDKYFLFFLLIIIITGNFNAFMPYFFLLFIHELGHTLAGIIEGYELEKIIIYPLGGLTILKYPLNIPLKKELFILLMGPLFQVLGYIFLKPFFSFITSYHYTLLLFNLLPIYPLDGGKILNIICSYHYNYLKSLTITFYISLFAIIGLFIYNLTSFNLNLFFMIILIIIKLIEIYKKRSLYYQRFLLERYLYNYSYKRIKNIKSIKEFYRDCEHYLHFISEKKILQKYFKSR